MFYTQVVPTPQGYVLQTSANEIPETNLRRIIATFYGDPAEKQAELQQHEHENRLIEKPNGRSRNSWKPKKDTVGNRTEAPRTPGKGRALTKVERERPVAQVPFFTNPTLCSGSPQVATVYIDSWQHPGAFNPNGTPDVNSSGVDQG